MINAIISTVIIALSSMFLKINIGTLGYLSLCDGLIVLLLENQPASIAMMCASLACVAADVFNGCRYYGLTTVIVKGAIGYLAAFMKKKELKYSWTAVFLSVIGYGLTDWLIMKNTSYLGRSLCYNLIQSILSVLLIESVRLVRKKRG